MNRAKDISVLQELVDELLGRITALEASDARLAAENVQLRAENVQLRAENVQLRAENVQLRAENARLKRQLNQDSHNSHRPPSSDGYWPLPFTMLSPSPIIKPNETCVRQKSNRKSPQAFARLKAHNTMPAYKPSFQP